MKLIKWLKDKNVCNYDKYWYVRHAYGRGLVHIAIPMEIGGDLYQAVMLSTVVSLKFPELPIGLLILGLVGLQIIYIMFRLWLGHKDLQRGWFERDTRNSNKYNPDLQEIKKAVQRGR